MELVNDVARDPSAPGARFAVETALSLIQPAAPHVAEELWERLGHDASLVRTDFPTADAQWLTVDTVEVAVQVNGKVRTRVAVAADLDPAGTEAAVRADAKVAELLAGKTERKVVAVPGRLVNFVLG
jgi:leucyl-tRNA synthetase